MKKRKEEKTGATMVDNSRQTHVIKLLGLEEEENKFSSLERKSRMQNQVRFYRDFYRALCAPECNLEGVNIPLRRSRLSGKMETTCPDRRKPL